MKSARQIVRRIGLIGAVIFGVLIGPPIEGRQVQLPDLEDQLVDPFAGGSKATVFLFISTDCPISNRYAPEVRRLYENFASRDVAFWLIYPNPAETVAAIQNHVNAFSYPGRTLRDPRHELTKLALATVTPSAAVFDRNGQLVYRGRIDNRYVDFGVARPRPTTHDLEDALDAVLAGKGVPEPVTQAVGCFLVDFLR